VSDGAGGAIIAWGDGRSGTTGVSDCEDPWGNCDIYAQHVSPDGEVKWKANGVPISAAPNNQVAPRIVMDGAGGALISWRDCRDYATRDSCFSGADLYFQHMSAAGLPLGPVDGSPLSRAPGSQGVQYGSSLMPSVVAAIDGLGGAILAWPDGRNGPCFDGPGGSECDVYAQRLTTARTLSVGDVTGVRRATGTSILSFTVQLSAPSDATVTVSYSTVDDTAIAGTDYLATSGVLTFPSGSTTQAIPVSILASTTPGPNRAFVLTLAAATDAVIARDRASGLILSGAPAGFFTVAPCRLVDTRLSMGGSVFHAGSTQAFTVAGNCGVAATATAVALNVTVVNETDVGHMRLYPDWGGEPDSSTINFKAGTVRANNAIISIGANGRIAATCHLPPSSPGQTHLVVDVTGYFR
jgi:hypothetical protein